jgi:hypothetical protein
VPRRLMLALVATTVATTALAAGCSVELKPGAVPAPISIAPTPSASAGVPKYVCSTAYKILTDGAFKLAQYATSSGDDAKAAMRQTFTDMAAQVDAEIARTTDPALKSALTSMSSELTAAGKQSDPAAYLNGDFQTVGQKLDGKCG